MPSPTPPISPYNFDLTPSTILHSAHQLIQATNAVFDQISLIEPPSSATFQNAILLILRDEDARSATYRIISFFDNVSPSKEMRDAATQVKSLMQRHDAERWSRRDVYLVVEAVWHQHQAGLSLKEKEEDEDWLALDSLRGEFLQRGCGVHDPTLRKRVTEIEVRIKDIQREYRSNIDADMSGQVFTAGELTGLSEDHLAKWKKKDNKELYFVNYKRPNINAIMAFVESEQTRKKLWLGKEGRLLASNGPLQKELVLLRDERARILGHSSHAHFREADRMLNTGAARAFLDKFEEQLRPLGEVAMGKLRALKAEHLSVTEEDTVVHHWDVAFYQRRQSLARTKVDQKLAVEYFPLEEVLPKVMRLLELFFGVKFWKVEEGGASTWHKDVRCFTVWDEEALDGGFLGYLYLDMFPRDFKHAHRSHYALQRSFTNPDGSPHHPSSVLLTNFPPLLPYSEVTSTFHELTHAVHNLVRQAPLYKHSRTHGLLPRDFIEIPCRTVERLFFTEGILAGLSCPHYQTGYAMPQEMMSGVVAEGARGDDVVSMMHDFWVARYDMGVHDPRGEMPEMDLLEVSNEMRRGITLRVGTEDEEWEGKRSRWEGMGGFSHLRLMFAGSYDSVYYSYLLAEAFSHDLYTSRIKNTLPSGSSSSGNLEEAVTEAFKAEGRRYRKMMLERGAGPKSYYGILTEYLDREPSSQGYIQGLSA